MISTSTPKSSSRPRISRTLPLGLCVADGQSVISTTAVVEDADHRGVGTVYCANDAAFGAAVGTDVGDFHQDLIAVHGGADLVRGDEDVASEFRFERAA